MGSLGHLSEPCVPGAVYRHGSPKVHYSSKPPPNSFIPYRYATCLSILVTIVTYICRFFALGPSLSLPNCLPARLPGPALISPQCVAIVALQAQAYKPMVMPRR